MTNEGWSNGDGGVLPPPPTSALSAAEAARKAQANAPSTTPTPAEVAAQVNAPPPDAIPATRPHVEHATPPSANPAPAPARPGIEPPPPKREPKYRMGSFLKIPGGFSGRVVKIYSDYESVLEDDDVKEIGVERVLRGKQGTSIPSTYEQPFYRVTSNRFDFDLVVGELDAHLISQGPGA